jgi:hypothetical protein
VPWLTLIPGGAGCAIFWAWLFSQQQPPLLMSTPTSFRNCNIMPRVSEVWNTSTCALPVTDVIEHCSGNRVSQLAMADATNCAITRIRHAVPRLMLNLDPGSSRSGTRFAGRVRLPSTCSQARIVMRHPAAAIYARLMTATHASSQYHTTSAVQSSASAGSADLTAATNRAIQIPALALYRWALRG